MTVTTSPRRAGRIDGLDLARGLAVLGMIAAHFAPPHPGFDWTVPASWPSVVDGRSAVLFALCAGVSLTLMTRPAPGVDPAVDVVTHRRRTVLRAVALFVIGALLMALATPIQVILPTYSVCFVATLPFLRARGRTVALAALLALVIGPLVMVVGRSVLHTAQDPLVHGVLLGAYPGLTWWGVVLVGLLVGRLPLTTARTQGTLLAIGAAAAVLGYASGFLAEAVRGLPADASAADASPSDASGGPTASGPGAASGSAVIPDGTTGPQLVPQGGGSAEHPEIDWGVLTSIDPHAGSTPEVVGALGVALSVLALSLLAAGRMRVLTAPLRAVGALALTVYVGHVLAYWVLGLAGADQGDGGWTLTVVVAAGALLVAGLWRRLFGIGPLERLVRRTSRCLDTPGPRSPQR